jgi:ProP effector
VSNNLGRGPPSSKSEASAATAAFDLRLGKVRPLALGIHIAIHEAAPALDHRALGDALRFLTGHPAYLKAMLPGAPRVDLAGEPSGTVSPEQAGHAREKLQAAVARAAAKKAAASRAKVAGAGNTIPGKVAPAVARTGGTTAPKPPPSKPDPVRVRASLDGLRAAAAARREGVR